MQRLTHTTALLGAVIVVLAMAAGFLGARVVAAPPAAAVGTAIPFQGFLQENGVNVTGTRDLSFTLFDAPAGGSQVGSTVTKAGLAITNGLYATSLDFGAAPWTSGEARWIEVAVGTQVLSPRTQVLPAPQALYASQAGNATQAGNAAQLGGIPASHFATLYGTGLQGPLTVNSSFTLPPGIHDYTDITINAGTLSVSSGSLIRCTGNLTIDPGATLNVLQPPLGNPPPSGNLFSGFDQVQTEPPALGAHGTPGQAGAAGTNRAEGYGGRGFGPAAALQIRDPGIRGGGWSPNTRTGTNVTTGPTIGGGTLVVRCAGTITINGTLRANGQNGSAGTGGGGGGIILLGAGTAIAGSGVIEARGGTGGNQASNVVGPGGGGGGGLILQISPVNTHSGPIDVTGGSGGTISGSLDATGVTRAGPGGGGSCGNGGNGAWANTANLLTQALTGTGAAGCAFTLLVSPATFW